MIKPDYAEFDNPKLAKIYDGFNPHQFSVPSGRRWSEFQYPSAPHFDTIEQCLNPQSTDALVTVFTSVTTT
jgi:hypothetical protein